MIRLLSYALLISFVVLLTPRDLWHDCKHEAHHHEELTSLHDDQGHDSETELAEDDCFACDFDLGVISSPVQASFNFDKVVYPNKVVIGVLRIDLNTPFVFSLRGPPQI
jgi:hypothetical protein